MEETKRAIDPVPAPSVAETLREMKDARYAHTGRETWSNGQYVHSPEQREALEAGARALEEREAELSDPAEQRAERYAMEAEGLTRRLMAAEAREAQARAALLALVEKFSEIATAMERESAEQDRSPYGTGRERAIYCDGKAIAIKYCATELRATLDAAPPLNEEGAADE